MIKMSRTRSVNKMGKVRTGRARFTAAFSVLLILFFAVMVLNISIGSVQIGFFDVIKMTAKAIGAAFKDLFTGTDRLNELILGEPKGRILISIRIPRVLIAAILGGSLSVSGYLLQVFFRNPIAGPFVLGISSGAKMIVGITLIFLAGSLGTIGKGGLIFAAFLGALAVTGIVLVLAGKVRNMSLLLVVGIMIGYICSAVTDFAINFASDHDIVNLTNWSMGSFSGAAWSDVLLSFCICIPAVIVARLMSKPIEAYALGEGYAKSMGVNIKLTRVMLIVTSSILSACVTALAGPISFVGIAVPHVARKILKSSNPRYIIPVSFVLGGMFCMLCDLIARYVFAPAELSLSTVTAIFGAPIVIVMLLRKERSV